MAMKYIQMRRASHVRLMPRKFLKGCVVQQKCMLQNFDISQDIAYGTVI